MPKGHGRESGEWTAGGDRGSRVALNVFERQFVDKDAIKKMLNKFTNGALSPAQIDAIVGQIIDHISKTDGEKLERISPDSNGQIQLTPEQMRIIQQQIDKLSPDLRGIVQKKFDRAIKSGTVSCPQCTG